MSDLTTVSPSTQDPTPSPATSGAATLAPDDSLDTAPAPAEAVEMAEAEAAGEPEGPAAPAEEAAAEVAAEVAEADEPRAEAPPEAPEPETPDAEAVEPPGSEAVMAEAAEAEMAEAAEAEMEPPAEVDEAEDDEAGPALAYPTAVAVADADAEPGETMTLLEQALAAKSPVQGQIIGWNKGGYHVAIGKIAAFCPVSQIEIGSPRSPKRYLDKEFPFHVIEIQQGGRRVVVSRAAALQAEKEARAALVREHLKPRAVLEGKVSSLTDFGAFVDLGGGIEGLVHVSELSRRRVDHPREVVKKNQPVKVQVLKIEKNGERISLSMKRLEADPWAGVAKRHPAGSKFTGKILRHTDFGIFVELEPGIEGLVHTSRLPLGIEPSHDSLEAGREVSGWVHEVEARRRRISLSLREVAKSNPWHGVAERFPEGEVVQGKVERLTNFGVFVELEPGLTGLLPFALLTGAGNPRRRYQPGKQVAVRVLAIDPQRKRISLGTEASQAEGSTRDYKEYLKSQSRPRGGMTAIAAAFAKLKDQR